MGNTVFVMRSLEGPKKGRQKGDTGSRKDIFRVGETLSGYKIKEKAMSFLQVEDASWEAGEMQF